MSSGGLTQPEWSPCTSTHLICARFLEDEVDPLSGYDSCLGAGVPHVAALALAPDPLYAGLRVKENLESKWRVCALKIKPVSALTTITGYKKLIVDGRMTRNKIRG